MNLFGHFEPQTFTGKDDNTVRTSRLNVLWSGTPKRKAVILMADDDSDDRMLVKDAFTETRPEIELAVANAANGRAPAIRT